MSNASRLARLAAALGIGGVALLLMVAGIAQSPAARADRRVYTVAALEGLLARHPAAWINRTLQVRARLEACLLGIDGPGSPCHEQHPILVDIGPGQHVDALPLVRGRVVPLLVALRRLPLIGRLVPPPQMPQWGTEGTYRVRLRATPASSCALPLCYEAVLLDAP